MSSYQEASGKPSVLLEFNQNLRDGTDRYSPTWGERKLQQARLEGGGGWRAASVIEWLGEKRDNCPLNSQRSGISALPCTEWGVSAQPHFLIEAVAFLLPP